MTDPQTLIHQDGRKATWFELFFDLIFVVAVASLASRFSVHYNALGAAEFGFLFLVLWWLWLGHTFHASRFDQDRPDQWAIGFAQMLAVVFIAYGASDAFDAGSSAFAGGVSAFKALLCLGYMREISRPGLARLCRLYAGIYGVQAVLWAASIWAGGPWMVALWAGALALDNFIPFLVARETHRAPPHPEHLPERFGLFTIILLGETAAAAVHALDHGGALHWDTALVAVMGAMLGFSYWIGYFHRAKGQAQRHIDSAAAGQKLRLWAYGHIPLYLGIASLGAGTVYLAHHMDGVMAAWVFATGAALAMLGVTLVSIATHHRRASAQWPYFAVAAGCLSAPLLTTQTLPLMALILILTAIQIGLSVYLGRPQPSV